MMPKLRGETIKYYVYLKAEIVAEIEATADNMETYQTDLITDAFNLYSNLYVKWEDEFSNTPKSECISFEEWLESLL